MKNRKKKAVLGVTAFIDLLGFSSHLELASFDLRTEVGRSAYSRLQIIESAIELFESEKKDFENLYPKTLRYQRFNDALILGIDINDIIVPRIGDTNVSDGYGYEQLKKLAKGGSTKDIATAYDKYYGAESMKVGLFIGLVARIHDYINDKEQEINMPGCRSVVSTGLRFRFYDRNGKEDFNSANFSFTNAYIVNEAGSSKGFSGNELYLDDNAAKICGFSDYTKRLISFTNIVPLYPNNDPYSGVTDSFIIGQTRYIKTKPTPIKLFGKEYIFRPINSRTASNFQLLPLLIELANSNIDYDELIAKPLVNCISMDSPTLSEINKLDSAWREYPLLSISYSLTEKYGELVDLLKKKKT